MNPREGAMVSFGMRSLAVAAAAFGVAGMWSPAGAADSKMIVADGSSTVYPITEAVAEEFQRANPGVKATIGISGTGGGFKKFCAGETDISNASRPIKPTEVEACAASKVEYIELPIAYDGLAVIVNPKNDWVDCLTVADLKKMWEPEAQGKVSKWSQVRDGWPANDLHLFGPGVDSGTYDYFTEAVVGKEHSSRGDFQSSEDDNTLVQGVSADRAALGFFGYAYYEENKSKLKLLGIDDGKDENGKGCIKPSRETVEKGEYQPLARPLFIYVRKQSAERPDIQKFIAFYLEQGPTLVDEVGYIALPAEAYKLARKRFDDKVTGSLFGGKGSQVGVTIVDLLKKEQ
jgi:phosphate transport system substrate-binding protein